MKLIKLSDTHYIGIDDSEIKEGDYKICLNDKAISRYLCKKSIESDTLCKDCKKITHSNQPLENINFVDEAEGKIIPKIKPLSLSEVEEAINGYSVEKMAENAENLEYSDVDPLDPCGYSGVDFNVGYQKGFNAHKELVKDKLFTVEDMEKAIELGNETKLLHKVQHPFERSQQIKRIIQSLLPKTEWEVKEITSEGKIVLL